MAGHETRAPAEGDVRGLTGRQRQVLDFMKSFTDRHGVPPAVREIGERFGFTARAAFDHLRALEKKGMLERRVTGKRASRTLVVPDRTSSRRASREHIPLLGRIAAGPPRLAEQQWDDAVPLDPGWLAAQGEDVFALRVSGDSMVQAHIVDGDMVLVRRQDTARAGDVVAALVGDEATVKRFGRDGDAIVLKAEHPTMAPIVVPPGRTDVRILGKVVGVLRRI